MNGVAPATATASVGLGGGVVAGGMPLAGTSLLPPPEQPVGSIESLYALMEQANAQQQKNGKVQVEGKFEAKRAALEKFQAELKKAAEEKSSGILGTLATIGAVAAAVVGTVCTCGAAAPTLVIVGVAISTGGFLVGETKCLDFIAPDVSKWVGLTMAVAGAVLTAGAGLSAAAGTGASAGASASASAGAGAGGAGASAGAGAASAGASAGASAASTGATAAGASASAGAGAGSALKTATTAVKFIEAGSSIASGLQTADDAIHERRADGYRIEAQAAQHQMQRIQDAIEEIITELQDAKDASGRRSEAVSNIKQTEGQTLLIAAGGKS